MTDAMVTPKLVNAHFQLIMAGCFQRTNVSCAALEKAFSFLRKIILLAWLALTVPRAVIFEY